MNVGPIGVFDSGLGGLTVLDQLLKSQLGHSYIYFGDTLHVPYGDRDAENVIDLVSTIATYLVGQGCQGLILACNTSSALAITALREIVDVPVLGVIEATSAEAAHLTRGRVAVLANPLTAKSGAYRKRIRECFLCEERRGELEVLEVGCPDLVPIVERGLLHTPESKEILSGYARRLREFGTDTLILGCTHYPLLLPVLRPMLGDSVHIVNPATLMPSLVSDWPKAEGELNPTRFEVSGEPEGFNTEASLFLGYTVQANQVDLSLSVS